MFFSCNLIGQLCLDGLGYSSRTVIGRALFCKSQPGLLSCEQLLHLSVDRRDMLKWRFRYLRTKKCSQNLFVCQQKFQCTSVVRDQYLNVFKQNSKHSLTSHGTFLDNPTPSYLHLLYMLNLSINS